MDRLLRRTVTDYIVWQSRPTGLVNGAQAEWLLAQADAGCTLNAFAILVNVLAEADRAPAWLPAAVHGRAAALARRRRRPSRGRAA